MDLHTPNKNFSRTKSNPVDINQQTCTTCHKAFASPGNLLRRNTAKHAPEVTKYECWYCGKLYCHRETTIKQTKKQHPGQDIRVDTQLIRKLDIFKPDPWSPPTEALNKTQYHLLIRSSNQQTQTAMKPSQKPYRAIRIEQVLLSLHTHTDRTSPPASTTQQLMSYLCLSSTDTSASSSTTDLQDKPVQEQTTPDITGIRIYGIFNYTAYKQ